MSVTSGYSLPLNKEDFEMCCVVLLCVSSLCVCVCLCCLYCCESCFVAVLRLPCVILCVVLMLPGVASCVVSLDRERYLTVTKPYSVCI